MGMSGLLALLAVISFVLWVGFAIFTLAVVRYWSKHPLADKVSDSIEGLYTRIDELRRTYRRNVNQ